MSDSFDFKAPDLFTTGAIGPPGQRVFYLQARERGVLVTLKIEKEQVGALAEYMAGLLARLPGTTAAAGDDLALIEPIVPAWAVRSLGVGYDEDDNRVVIVAQEQTEEEDGEEEGTEAPESEPETETEADAADEEEGASARFRVSPAQAAAFVERARTLIKAGRPPCPICGRPINPEGHVCPRSNGHGRG